MRPCDEHEHPHSLAGIGQSAELVDPCPAVDELAGGVEVSGVGRCLDGDVVQDLGHRVESPRAEHVGRPPGGCSVEREVGDPGATAFAGEDELRDESVDRNVRCDVEVVAGRWDEWVAPATAPRVEAERRLARPID